MPGATTSRADSPRRTSARATLQATSTATIPMPDQYANVPTRSFPTAVLHVSTPSIAAIATNQIQLLLIGSPRPVTPSWRSADHRAGGSADVLEVPVLGVGAGPLRPARRAPAERGALAHEPAALRGVPAVLAGQLGHVE